MRKLQIQNTLLPLCLYVDTCVQIVGLFLFPHYLQYSTLSPNRRKHNSISLNLLLWPFISIWVWRTWMLWANLWFQIYKDGTVFTSIPSSSRSCVNFFFTTPANANNYYLVQFSVISSFLHVMIKIHNIKTFSIMLLSSSRDAMLYGIFSSKSSRNIFHIFVIKFDSITLAAQFYTSIENPPF